MEKEKVLEIEIKKINSEYSLAIVKKMNRKVIEEKNKYKFGYANSSRLETNSELHKDPNFRTYISDTILCSDLYLNSENDCFTIKNNLVESLELFLQEFNEEYGIPKRWKPKLEESFFIVERVRTEVSFKWVVTDLVYKNDHWIDFYAINSGNCFETYEEAEKVVLKLEELEKNFWAKVREGEIGE